MLGDWRLIKVGGYFALIVAAMQIVGNGLHPPIPAETIPALELIAGTGYWTVIHVLITISYFMFIPFVIGASVAFKDRESPFISVARSLVIVGAGLGAAQIMTHLTFFKYLADRYVASAGDVTLQGNIMFTYESFWPYNTALEVAHLIAIFIAVILFGIALVREDVFPRWLGQLGIGAGAFATAAILVGKVVLNRDIIFGIGLIPLVIWLLIIGVQLVRLKVPASGGSS